MIMIYVETGLHTASNVVYKVKRSGPSVEPCGTTYDSVTLSEKISLIFKDWCLFYK